MCHFQVCLLFCFLCHSLHSTIFPSATLPTYTNVPSVSSIAKSIYLVRIPSFPHCRAHVAQRLPGGAHARPPPPAGTRGRPRLHVPSPISRLPARNAFTHLPTWLPLRMENGTLLHTTCPRPWKTARESSRVEPFLRMRVKFIHAPIYPCPFTTPPHATTCSRYLPAVTPPGGGRATCIGAHQRLRSVWFDPGALPHLLRYLTSSRGSRAPFVGFCCAPTLVLPSGRSYTAMLL